jgi:hypothetical protein
MSWVLYSVAHYNTRIKSPDGEAWVKILGFFPSKNAALTHAQHTNEEIRIAPVNEFRLVMQNTPKSENREEETRKHSSLLDLHKNHRRRAFEETAKNASERLMGSLGFSVVERMNHFKEQYGIKADPVHNILDQSACKEVRMQKFCALSIVPDYERIQESEKALDEWKQKRQEAFAKERNAVFTKLVGDKMIPQGENPWTFLGVPEPDIVECTQSFIQECPVPSVMVHAEPAIKFMYAANTEDEIKTFILKHCNSQQERDFDVACVAMYEWIKIANFNEEKIKRTFREPELAKLHSNKDLNKLEAQSLVGRSKEINIVA